MIHRNHGDISFECDFCGETLDTHESEWGTAWNIAKSDGWRSKKVDNQWEHFCPKCNLRPF